MSTFSPEWYRGWLARCELGRAERAGTIATEEDERESDLHSAILATCRQRGWIALHGSMASPTHRTEGEPDFVILAAGGQVLLIECKSRTGKLNPAQAALHAWARKLGHTVHVVRSTADWAECMAGMANET